MHRILVPVLAAAAITAAACGSATADPAESPTATAAAAAAPTASTPPAAPTATGTTPPASAATQADPPTTTTSTTTSTTTTAAPAPTTSTTPAPSTTSTTAPTPTTTTTAAATTSTTDAATSTTDAAASAETTDTPQDRSTDATPPTEPTPEPSTEPTPEPSTEPTPEPSTEPTPEPPGAAPADGGLGDSLYAQLGNAGYDVLHYDIELDVDPATNTISALTTITALATEDMPSFNLDLSGLEVHDVTVDGVAAEFSRAGSELTVRPGPALVQGEEFSVSVGYSGVPEPIDDPGVPFTTLGWNSVDGVIYTLSQPSGAMTWFPSNNHPSDKATFELRITVPDSTTAAATGLLIDETTDGGRTTTTWRMDDPMATYLTAVYVGDFERVEHGRLEPDGPLLRDYVPGDAGPEVAEALAVTADALRFLEALLGPYPFDAYGTLVLPIPLDLALENQTLPVHGRDFLQPFIIAHEAAHQWLGNSVALEDWGDIWLNEGFATYLHIWFDVEHHGGDFDAYMQRLHAELPSLAGTPPKGITLEELFGPSVYLRGAMTLHALRLHAGEEVFLTILRAHYERSAGDTTNTEEFLGIVDEFAGPGAVAVVESWLYDEAVPDLPEPQAG